MSECNPSSERSRCFAALGGPAGVTDVADRVTLPKSTVSRMLSTLEELGMVEQIEPGGNYASVRAWSRSPRSAARSHTDRRGAATSAFAGEGHRRGAGLSIVDGFDMLYLDQVDADNQVQVRDWTGERSGPHRVVGPGDVGLRRDRCRQLSRPATRAHRQRHADRCRAIRSRFAEIAARGTPGIRGVPRRAQLVAAPIRDSAGRVVGPSTPMGPRIASGEVDADEVGRWSPRPPNVYSYDDVRLRDRRRWFGRLGSGQPPQR